MARTQAEILQEINTYADAQAPLATLQSNTSRVSVWRLCKQLLAHFIHAYEVLRDQHQEAVLKLLLGQQVGSKQWYAEHARAFQYGHDVVLVDNRPAYVDDDLDARIISHVSVTANDQTGKIYCKVVTQDAAGNLTPLTNLQKGAFQAYMSQIGFAGLPILVQSEAALSVRFTAYIQVDNQRIDPTTGRALGTEKEPVKEALDTFLQQLPFDGLLKGTALTDAVQAVPGVLDVLLLPFYLEGDATAHYASARPLSGHTKLDPAATFHYSITPINR